jgi:hypothetical protein
MRNLEKRIELYWNLVLYSCCGSGTSRVDFFFAGSVGSETRACRSGSRSETRSDLLDNLKTVPFLNLKVSSSLLNTSFFP